MAKIETIFRESDYQRFLSGGVGVGNYPVPKERDLHREEVCKETARISRLRKEGHRLLQEAEKAEEGLERNYRVVLTHPEGSNPSLWQFCRKWEVHSSARVADGKNIFADRLAAESECYKRNLRDGGDWQEFLTC